MIDYFKAIRLMFNSLNKHIKKINYSKTSLIDSINNSSYNKIKANKNIPTFKNSAMDGYIIKYACLKKNNSEFKVLDEIKAGDNYIKKNNNLNTALEIMTGARVPKNFDSVIKIEDITHIKNNKILINNKIKKNQNIRNIGEDFKKKDIIIKQCEKITANKIISLASFGINKITTLKEPNIYIIATGNELTENDYTYNSNFLIYNTSSPYFFAYLKTHFKNFIYLGITKDNIDNFLTKIIRILTCNYFSILITTGGVSKGKYDFIPQILKKIGINIIFHNVNIKPGKPILFAKYKEHVYIFCLPGNPISSIIGLNFFIQPFIDFFINQNLKKPIKAKVINNYKKKYNRYTFLKSFVFFKNSILYVKILKNQESFKVKNLLKANSFVFLKKNDIIKKNILTDIYLTNNFNI